MAKGSDKDTTGLSQEQMDYLAVLHEIPAARLDADMYAADDLDGATEGLSGSGNLNYLILQSQQTNDARQVNDPFNIDNNGGLGDGVGGLAGGAPGGIGGGQGGGDNLTRAVDGEGSMGDLDAGPQSLDGQNGDAGGIGGGMGGGVAPISALSFNSGTSSSLNQLYGGDEFNDVTNITDGGPGLPGDPGLNGGNGNDGGNGNNGNNGNGGNNGNNGNNGGPGPSGPPGPPGPGHEDPPVDDGDDVDLTIDLDTGILDSDYDINLDLIEEILGDLDIDIDGAINDILNGGLLGGSGLGIDLDHLGNGLLDLDSDNLIGTTVTALEDIVNGLVNYLPGGITNLVTSPLDILHDLLGFNGDGDTDLVINLLPNLPLDIPLLDMISLHVPLDPVEMILGDLDINIDAVLADILNGSILQDTDLLLSAFHNDNDLLSLASDDILAPALDLVNGLTGNMLDSILNGPGAGDTDISIGILSNLGFMGGGVSNIHIPLDAAETLLSDIDLDIDNLLSLDTILDADGLTNGDLPGLGVGIDLVTDILPGLDTDLSLEDPGGSVESILTGLEDMLGDLDIEDTLATLADNLADGLATDGGLLDDFLTDVTGAPGGDIAADAGAALEGSVDALLGGGDAADGLTDIVGGLLSGAGGEDGDEDLTIDTGISILGIEIDDIDIEVPLDIVESLVGDIDIDVDAGAIIDALGEGDVTDAIGAALGVEADIDLLDPLLGDGGLSLFEDIGAAAGDGDEGLDWPEASITDGLDDVLGGGLLSGAGEVLNLPDPVGVVTEGLGSLIDDTPLNLGGGGGGGLFGGLFG